MSTLQSSKNANAFSPLRKILAVFIALVGVAYTVAAAQGMADSVCVTAGCELYKDTKLFGYSLWWFGTAGFTLVGLLALLGRIGLARFAAGVGLLIDVGLLGLLALTAPCISCLVAGFLLLLLFFVLATPMGMAGRVIVIAWLLVFSPNIIGAMKSVTDPWPIYGEGNASIRLYFSPTCPACLLSANEALAVYPENSALFPLAKSDSDARMITALVRHLADGNPMPKDLGAFFANTPPEASPEPGPDLRWKLFRNELAFSSLGAEQVPFLMMSGRPGSLPSAEPKPDPGRPGFPSQPDRPGLSRDLPPGMTPAQPSIPSPIFPQSQGSPTFSGCNPSEEPCPDTNSSLLDKELE